MAMLADLPPTLQIAPRNSARNESLAGFALHLARRVANAADADLYAIALVGVPGTGDPDFEGPVPRSLLESLNDGRPARYRITLVLQADGRDLGILRLGTTRPAGFTDADVEAARSAARHASVALARTLEQASLMDESEMASPAPSVIAFDEHHRIRLFTHPAEALFGWGAEEVVGRTCQSVFACKDEDGRPLCGSCGLDATIQGSDHVWLRNIAMASRSGKPVNVDVSYWRLPSSGNGSRFRVLTSVNGRSPVGVASAS